MAEPSESLRRALDAVDRAEQSRMGPRQRAEAALAAQTERERELAPGGAPPAARLRANLGIGAGGSEQELAEVRAALERTLGGEFETRVGPSEGLEFRAVGDEQFTRFNEPGLDLADFAAATPEIAQTVTEVIAGLGGLVAGSGGGPMLAGTGAVLAEAGTALLTQVVKIEVARAQGLKISNEEQIISALERSGLVALFGAGSGALISIVRRLIAGVDSELAKAVTPELIKKGLKRITASRASISVRTGQDFPVTTGQAVEAGETAESSVVAGELLGAENLATTFRAEGAEVRAVITQQRKIADELEKEVFGGVPTARQALTAQRELEKSAADAQRAALGRAVSPSSAAASMRAGLQESRETVLAPLRTQFDELRAEVDIVIPPSELLAIRKEFQAIGTSAQRLFPSLSVKQNKLFLREGTQVGLTKGKARQTEIVPGIFVDSPAAAKKRAVSLGEMQETLSDVRDGLRAIDRRTQPKLFGLLVRTEKALRKARNSAFKDDPEGLADVLKLEASYKLAKDSFDRGVVGEITRVDKVTGIARLSGTEAVALALSSPETAMRLVGVLKSVPGGRAILDDLRRGALGNIRDRFTDDAGRLQATRLGTYMRNNRDTLEIILGTEKSTALKSARDLTRFVDDTARQTETIRGRVRELLGVDSADPGDIARQLFLEGDPKAVNAVVKLLRDDPARLASLKQIVARAVFDRVKTVEARTGTIKASSEAITQLLDSAELEFVRPILGQRFVAGLRTLRDVLRIAELRPISGSPVELRRSFTRGVPALQGVARFLRVVFPPLSRSGRGLTASLGLVSEQTRRSISNALADPEHLVRMLELRKFKLGDAAALPLLAALEMNGLVALQEIFGGAPAPSRAALSLKEEARDTPAIGP